MAKGKCVDWENKKNVVTMCDLRIEEWKGTDGVLNYLYQEGHYI
jgi:hypothetical protein